MDDDPVATTLILEALFDIRIGVGYLVSRATEEDEDGPGEAEED